MSLSSLLGISRIVPQKKTGQNGHTMNPLITKLVRSRWLDIGLVLFDVFIDRDHVVVDKSTKTNLVNIQPTSPHAW